MSIPKNSPFWTWPEPRKRPDGTVEYLPDDAGDIHRPPLEEGCMVNDCYHARDEPEPEGLQERKDRFEEELRRSRELIDELKKRYPDKAHMEILRMSRQLEERADDFVHRLRDSLASPPDSIH